MKPKPRRRRKMPPAWVATEDQVLAATRDAVRQYGTHEGFALEIQAIDCLATALRENKVVVSFAKKRSRKGRIDLGPESTRLVGCLLHLGIMRADQEAKADWFGDG